MKPDPKNLPQVNSSRTEQILQARLRLHQFADNHTLDELIEETLNEAENLTDSLIGFYHFVNIEQETLTLQNWSTRTKREFCHAEGKGMHYPFAEAGVWMDCVRIGAPVIHNDYPSLLNKRGLPEGHAWVQRELVVPVTRNKKVVAVLGIGNKSTGYDQEDVKTVSILADLAWDIAERKLAEEQLKRKEEKFKHLFETMSQGVFYQDAIAFMEALDKVHRFDNDTVEAIMAFYDKLARAMSQKEAALQQVKESEQLLQEAHESLEKRVNERTTELARSNKLLEETGRLARIGGWELDVQTNDITWTDMVYEIHEVDKDFNPNLQKGIGFYSPESTPVISKAIKKAIREGTPFDLELQLVTAKKNHLWVRAIGQAIWLNGCVSKLGGVFQDITRQKETENELIEIHKNLEVSNQELFFHLKEIEQFTYIASHDLQEPLRTLITFSQLLHDEFDNKLEGDGNRYIDFIQQSATRMSSLVSGLLDYALIGKTCEKSLVDMNDVLRIALENLDDIIKESKAVVRWGSLYSLNGYRIELRQLLQQLISNAIKFKQKDHIPEIRISMHKLSNEWLFTVEDNGIGIEEKDREKIFTIFKRMHNRKEIDGTGIGLAHCKKIVELHHGLIWVEPNTSEGSVIKFTLPMK